jgi:hypothetical protein
MLRCLLLWSALTGAPVGFDREQGRPQLHPLPTAEYDTGST